MVRTVSPNASDTPTKPIPRPVFGPAGVEERGGEDGAAGPPEHEHERAEELGP